MRNGTGALPATKARPERRLPDFGQALGHRLRQVREAEGMTAAEVAARATNWLGLGWDRSTVTRIELGQRQVSAAELLALPALYRRPVAELLPTEPCQLTESVGADPDVLRQSLTVLTHGYDIPKLWEALPVALERIGAAAKREMARFPDVPAMVVIDAASKAQNREEALVKAARRLGVDVLDVAVASQQLWDRGLTEERDSRVGSSGTPRARQAQRGHVTRQLLDELRPAVEELQEARKRKGGRRGQR